MTHISQIPRDKKRGSNIEPDSYENHGLCRCPSPSPERIPWGAWQCARCYRPVVSGIDGHATHRIQSEPFNDAR